MTNILSVLTSKSVETILAFGGTQSWALDRARAKACEYVVLCRNGRSADVEGTEAHGSAFMVGKIKDVVPAVDREGRWLVLLSEYALCDVGEQWEGRNPVAYWTDADYTEIDFSNLDFQPMPQPDVDLTELAPVRRLTIAEAKLALSATFDVPIAAIEITIRA